MSNRIIKTIIGLHGKTARLCHLWQQKIAVLSKSMDFGFVGRIMMSLQLIFILTKMLWPKDIFNYCLFIRNERIHINISRITQILSPRKGNIFFSFQCGNLLRWWRYNWSRIIRVWTIDLGHFKFYDVRKKMALRHKMPRMLPLQSVKANWNIYVLWHYNMFSN